MTDLITVIRDQHGVAEVLMPYASDKHNHARYGAIMRAVLPAQAQGLKYLLLMPNLQPAVATVEAALAYQAEANDVLAEHGLSTTIIPTIYFTDQLTPRMVEQIAKSDVRMAIKFYPPAKGATTNSGQGVPLFSMPDTLRAIEDNGVRLLIHGECTETAAGDALPHEEREGYFMTESYCRLRNDYPKMLISLEHISTLEAVARVKEDDSGNTVCTITPHHPLLSADVAFATSWANQARCMPYLKGEEHRQAIFDLMVSGDTRAILGTDCAPHLSAKKKGAFDDAACGCYVPHALAMYVSMFAQADALDERLVRFACHNGPDWWDLPRPTDKERLRFRRELTDDIPNPTVVPEANDIIIPLGWTENADRLRIGMRAVLS